MERSAVWVGLNSWHKMNVRVLLKVFFFFNSVMHFPYNVLCKQIVFLPAMKRCALLLTLQECREPAAQQPLGAGLEWSPGRLSAGPSSGDSSAACNEATRGDQVCGRNGLDGATEICLKSGGIGGKTLRYI